MFNVLGWPTIEKRHSDMKAVRTFQALNDLTTLYITELLIPMSQTHNRASNGSLAVPRSKTAIYDDSSHVLHHDCGISYLGLTKRHLP